MYIMLYVLSLLAPFLLVTSAAFAAADISCPPMPPEQLTDQVKADMFATAGVMMQYSDSQLRDVTRQKTKELLIKYRANMPDIADSFLAITCTMIKNSSTITDDEKLDKWDIVFPNVILVQSPSLSEVLGIGSTSVSNAATKMPDVNVPPVGAPVAAVSAEVGAGGSKMLQEIMSHHQNK